MQKRDVFTLATSDFLTPVYVTDYGNISKTYVWFFRLRDSTIEWLPFLLG